jgi:hypothetical protein
VQPLSFFARLALAFRILFRGPPPLPPKQEADPKEARETGALLLLSLLQREGRLVDFAMQDVSSFSDADIGAAARLVHDGCRKVLSSIEPVRTEDEGSAVTIDQTGPSVVLVGNVTGKGPWSGTLRHKGWRATKLTLPEPTREHERDLIAPAEIEI